MTQSSTSAALPTSTRLTFSTIREPSASTDPFSTCISYFLFGDPVPKLSNAASVASLPCGSTPGYTGRETPDRTSAEAQDIIDDQSKVVQPGRSERTNRAHGPGELLHHDEADGHDHAVPRRATRRADEPGQKPPGQQRAEGEQPLGHELASMTPDEQGATHQLNHDRDDQAQPGGEPIDPPPSARLRPRHGSGLSLSVRARRRRAGNRRAPAPPPGRAGSWRP